MLSFIIFNKNLTQDTIECIDSIFTFVEGAKEIVVVDNNSLPKPSMEIRNIFPTVKVIENPTTSYAKAANLGIRNTTGETIFLILPLLRFTKESNVQELADYFAGDAKIGILVPRTMNEDGTLYYTCRRFPKESNLIFKRLPSFLQVGKLKELDNYEMRDFDHRSITPIDWCVRSCMVFTRMAGQSVGMFDEAYDLYLEDLDFCRSMKEARKDILFFPHSVLLHKAKGPEKRDLNHMKGFLKALNHYFEKWNASKAK